MGKRTIVVSQVEYGDVPGDEVCKELIDILRSQALVRDPLATEGGDVPGAARNADPLSDQRVDP